MKVILAFSGGLDTCFCVQYLIEKGYEVITLTLDSGGFSDEDIDYIKNRSEELGAKKHYFKDIKKELFDEIGSKIIKANGLYQGVYPLMCSDRYLFPMYLNEIASKENTNIIAHGCTNTGNDQFRIEITASCFYPGLKIIAPVKELGITRDEEIRYLKKKGFSIPDKVKKYTINKNIFGVTLSGSEVDENKEIPEDAWIISKLKKNNEEYVEIGFDKGIPVTLNGKKLEGYKLLEKLNKIAGAHGYGRNVYVEDEILGIKGRQAFEAPGMILLIEAHKALEKLTLTREQLWIKSSLEYKWAELAYLGKLYDPVMENIESFINSTQEVVTGKVKMKLENKTAFLCGVHSENGLIDESIATYAQKAKWTGSEVNSFQKFYSLQQKIFKTINQNESKKTLGKKL